MGGTTMRSEQVIMSDGMKYLTEKLGFIEAEFFIHAVKKDAFDYTEWRREYFENAYNDGGGTQLENFLYSAGHNFPQSSFGLE
jgi:hypothetical protein